MIDDHPIKQPIIATQVVGDENGNPMDYIVGRNGVTKIDGCSKDGEYCSLPYIRVWAGDNCVMEFCQHKATFVRFGTQTT